jgi:hypothetical protein
VSLHVIGSGGIHGENLETSILQTTSGSGIIIRKQRPFMPTTFPPPQTIPLTYTISEPPTTRQSVSNPFTVPELPILHQFHDVDAILKASPKKNAESNSTLISHQSERFQGDFTVNSKWMRNNSRDGNINPTNSNLDTGSVSSGNQQWAEVLNVTMPTVKPQHNSYREVFSTRYHQQQAWGDMGNRARPGNRIPLKDTGIPSVESPLSRVQINTSTLNPLDDSVANTPFSIVTLIPVKSNSGVGRPLRPRPKLPSHTSVQIKNKTEPTEYTLRNKAVDSEDFSPSERPIGLGVVNGAQQTEISHETKNNVAGSTEKSEGTMISFSQSSLEAPQQEDENGALDHKSQSSDIKYSMQSPIFSRINSSASQQPMLSPFTHIISTEMPLTMDTVLTSIKETQTQSSINVPPLLSTATLETTSSVQQSTAEKLISPLKKGTISATSSTVTPITATALSLWRTTQPPTVPTIKVTETLPTKKLVQITTGTTAKVNDSSSADLPSNTNHESQINRTATGLIKNVTHRVESMVRISLVSTSNQPSVGEVHENTTAGNTKPNNIQMREMNGTDTSPTHSPYQQTLTTKTPSHLKQASTVTVPKHQNSTERPASIYTAPSEFIPVIVIQDSPDENWHRNNSGKQTVKGNSTKQTLDPPPTASNIPNSTGGQREYITMNTTNAITNSSKLQENLSLITPELRDKNLIQNGMAQNISTTISNRHGGNNSKEKPESVKENVINTTSQPHVVTPQTVILNTDTVTTTSIEISFGEDTEKVTVGPLNTSQSPNRIGITTAANIPNSSRVHAENVTTMKVLDNNHSSTADLPITQLPSIVKENMSTHKVKETRRQPKMKPTNAYISSLKNFRLEERMMDSTGNLKMEDKTDTDQPLSRVADVTNTTTTLSIISSEDNGTKNTTITGNYNYHVNFNVPRALFKLNSTTESLVPENYSSDQVSSEKEGIILTRTNGSSSAVTHLTKEGAPQKEGELQFNSSQSYVAQDSTLHKVNKGIIPTEEISTPNEDILSTKHEVTNTSNDASEIFTNFTVTKVTASSTMQGKQPPEDYEMSDDDVMHLLNETRNHSIMSQEAMNTLSKYANVHTAMSSNNATKGSQNSVHNDEDKTSNGPTENYVGENTTNIIATEQEKLTTKVILPHESSNHAGIPILTKIYNKAPQQFHEKEASTEAGSPDLANATGM